MAEFPALPLFTDAYLADTRHLSTEEHGAYLLLLICAWRTRGCNLKDDDRHLAKLVGVSAQRWRKLKPVLLDFFMVENGLWRQKKLTHIYETVARKVEKNRANGAKGGRSRAQQIAASSARNKAKAPSSGPTPGQANALANGPATKTKTKTRTKTKEAAGTGAAAGATAGAKTTSATPDDDQTNPNSGQTKPNDSQATGLTALAAASGISSATLDSSFLLKWQAAGADLEADILPTIRRIAAREQKKGTPSPAHLGYYDSAVLEARDKRLKAIKAGSSYAADHPASPPRTPFDATNPAHWRTFLGDTSGRYRADYIRRHWLIAHDHGLFAGGSLGPNPWDSFNPLIPPEIYTSYGPAWGWPLPHTPQKHRGQ